jgi:CubicO group peptidase (beta-lactamase class C family)
MSAPHDCFARIRDLIRRRLVDDCLPSLAVAVAQNGQILWEEAFGWADREARIPATPHTLYSLASISKPITATAIVLLGERGKLDLDRPINDYLRDAKLVARVGEADGATVRRVANHTSGLPLHWHFFPEDEPRAIPDADETIHRYGNLVTAPGERYRYSNLGYGILDTVISRLSGRSYADFLREELFLPLGMTRSSVDIAAGLEPYAAARYSRDGLRLPFYGFDHPGGSAVYCSAHDLIRFGLLHLKTPLDDQKRILSDSAIAEMQVPTATVGERSGYGIGWRIAEDFPGVVTVSHGGGMDGVNTSLVLVPEASLAVVALCNAAGSLPFDVTRELVLGLVPGATERPKPEKSEDAAAAFTPPAALLGEWHGAVHTHRGDLPFALQFFEDGDVHAQLGDQLRALVNEPKLEDGWLTGRFAGDVGTEDAARRPYCLHLDLRVRDAAINGAVVVRSPPGTKLDAALSHWTELRRP